MAVPAVKHGDDSFAEIIDNWLPLTYALNAVNRSMGLPDLYPFILLNLAFSLQAAYAAPLILLAQTRQADRDKALADADALHREALAAASIERQTLAMQQAAQLMELLQQNTELTRLTQQLSQRIETLTAEVHRRLVHDDR